MLFAFFSARHRPAHSYAKAARRSVSSFVVLMLCLFLIASMALVSIARTINEQQIHRSEVDLYNLMTMRLSYEGRAIIDNASWNEAYFNTKDQINTRWAYDGDNLGPWLFEGFGYEGVFIIGPQQDTRYAIINGELSQQDAMQWVSGNLTQLMQQARDVADDDSYAQGYFLVDGIPAIISAAVIKPSEDVPPAETLSVLVFVYVLTPDKLQAMANDFDLQNLHTELVDEADRLEPEITLQSDPGIRFKLRWDAENPGKALLHTFLPLLLLVGTVFAIIIWRLQRSVLRSALLTETAFERLQTSREALRQSEERFRDVAESASDWIWETNAQQELTYLSERFCSATGYDASAWLGRSLHSLLNYEESSFRALIDRAGHDMSGSDQPRLPLECQLTDSQGRQRFCSLFMRPIKAGDGITGYRGTVCDITEEVEAKAHVAYLSQHDALTGLPNRNYLYSFLQARLDAKPTPDNVLVVISLDLDRFKPINDTLGHAAGDQVLGEVAERLQECLRQNDLVARLGGDEFVIVAGGLTGQHLVDKLCSRILKSISQPFIVGEHELHIGTSMGIAIAPGDGQHAKELLRYADIALYEAKAAGRNTWLFYTAGMNERILERRQLETDLREALRNDELRLEFQPRYDIEHRQLSGAEALVRWEHPRLGRLYPDKFIPIAEETGLIVPLSNWVLRKACAEATQWEPHTFISVNLSPIEFLHGDLVARVRQALEFSGLEASRLELEITENVMLDDAETSLALMRQLKALGVRLSMDDFGTGYSSLSYLRNYPFDGIKIDRSFTADLNKTQGGQAIIEAILGLGRALSMTVTAEGVETIEQLDELIQMKCFHAQGYHLGRPMQAEALLALMNGSDMEITTSARDTFNEPMS